MGVLTYRVWTRLPDRWTGPLDVRRRRSHWERAGAVLVHVPKAAGTSVSHALYGRTLGHFRATDIQAVLGPDYGGLYAFGVVRHPLHRVRSAYRFARLGRTKTMGVADPGRYRGPAFATFDRFVLDWLVRQQPTTLDPVFRPQSYYLCDDSGHPAVHDILRLEHLSEQWAQVEQRIGRVMPLEQLNQTGASLAEPDGPEANHAVESYDAQDYATFGYATEANESTRRGTAGLAFATQPPARVGRSRSESWSVPSPWFSRSPSSRGSTHRPTMVARARSWRCRRW